MIMISLYTLSSIHFEAPLQAQQETTPPKHENMITCAILSTNIVLTSCRGLLKVTRVKEVTTYSERQSHLRKEDDKNKSATSLVSPGQWHFLPRQPFIRGGSQEALLASGISKSTAPQ